MIGGDQGERIDSFVTLRLALAARPALVGRRMTAEQEELIDQVIDAGATVTLMPLPYALYSIGVRADPVVERMGRDQCENWEVVDGIRKLWANPQVKVVRSGERQIPVIITN